MVENVGKVKLNYEFYNGTDSYSDGDIEEDLLDLVKNEKDVINILNNDNRWPIFYHLSPVRQNILEWYDFKNNASVLEIGSGCGAITGVLSKKASKVTCVELSKRRSLINANRNFECDNVEIYVGNYNDIVLNEKFDYITLIGVLEYADYYTDGNNSFVDFLINVKKYLKPDGKLLIAIENKYGMKYWSGAREDHTNVFFDGITDYNATSLKVRTFSKNKLKNMLDEAGFRTSAFYYPLPDYKLPTQIFSDAYLPSKEDLNYAVVSYDNSRAQLFDEKIALGSMVDEGMFGFFANSFFVEASYVDSIEDRKLYSKFTKERNEKYQIETFICCENGKKRLFKRALNDIGIEHIMKMFDYYNSNGDMLCETHRIDERTIEIQFVSGKTLCEEMLEAASINDREALWGLVNKYKDILIQSCKRDVINVDLTFENIIHTESGYLITDYEWLEEKQDDLFKYVAYRAIKSFDIKHAYKLKDLLTREEMFGLFQISEDELSIFEEKERDFNIEVFGDYVYEKKYRKRKIPAENILYSYLSAQLFYDLGSGFSEENSYIDIINSDIVEFRYRITKGMNIKRFRFDPIDRPGIIKNVSIKLIDMNESEHKVTSLLSNAEKTDNGIYYFYNKVPQIYFENFLGHNIKRVVVEYNIECSSVEEMYDKLLSSVMGNKKMKRIIGK